MLKILIRFHSPNKIDNYNRGGEKEKKKKKKSKRIYRTKQNIRIIFILLYEYIFIFIFYIHIHIQYNIHIQNIRIINFFESLLSEFFPLLGVTVRLISLECPPTLC